MKKRLYLAAAASLAVIAGTAQINSPFTDGDMLRAVQMFDNGNYQGCLDQLSNANTDLLSPSQKQEYDFYRACAAVHTDKKSAAQLLEKFLADYPESVHRFRAEMALGDCYYGSDYQRALSIYQKIEPKLLTGTYRDDLCYRTAYCYMITGDLDKALPLFEDLADSRTYDNASLFYQGYIAYSQKRYSQALELLSKADTSTPPGDMADYYLSQIYYMQGEYSRALSSAKSLLQAKAPSQYQAEAYRIAGESAYHLHDQSAALSYLQKYMSLTDSPVPSALYILGVDAYDKGNYSKAIEYLSPVTAVDDAMGQCAYLYLGQAYLNEFEYTDAAMAFNRALNMDYDPAVRETAYYNYAVASTLGGKAPFANTITIFSDFLRLYPRSKYAPQVQSHIINSYLTANNYKEALESIESMVMPTKETLAAKQRVLYALGVQALNGSDTKAALDYLREARTLRSHSAEIDREVSVALGEALYASGDLNAAAREFENYLRTAPRNAPNRAVAAYDLGYVLFSQKKYGNASSYFKTAVENGSTLTPSVIADAYNRLGDCYYYEKNFDYALKAYDSAYKQNPTTGDYALMQKALMLGYLRRHDEKISTLDALRRDFPSSALIPDAMLETTEAYIQMGNTQKALQVYRQLVNEYPNTAQGRQGALQMALVMLNSGDHAGAVKAYKEVITRYPTSDEARQAVEQMKRITAADGSLKDFIDFLSDTQGAPQLDQSEAERIAFEEAERAYLSDGKTGALLAYIYDFPTSDHRVHAILYLMESNVKDGNDDKAYEYAKLLWEQYPSHAYAQQALTTKAEIEERRDQPEMALQTWKSLTQVASSPAMLSKARMGVIRNARTTASYDDVIAATSAVLKASGVSETDRAEAAYSRAMAHRAKGDVQSALADWQTAATNKSTAWGMESAYNLGEYYLAASDLSQAEQWAKEVVNADSPHSYWIARGFILLSDVYAAKGDSFKSRQYIEALRDNYKGTEPDIQEMIKARLK